MIILIHYSEIALKGKNRSYFERKLMSNIRNMFVSNGLSVLMIKKEDSRLVLEAEGDKIALISSLKHVFGIRYFCFTDIVELNVDSILFKARDLINNTNKIRFVTKRSNKKFPLNSIELNTKYGEIANSKGISVDYTNFEKTLYTEITTNSAYLYAERFDGLGGLPVGVSGKVLVLLSGGIDSSVVAWLAMKRGCTVDFLHLHTFKENNEVVNTKIIKLANLLNKYQCRESKLFLVSYIDYEMLTLGKVSRGFDVVLFKHFMLRLGCEIAKRFKYKAIIVGDAIGQVASQTLDNINASRAGLECTVLSPLITFDKEEIIGLAKEIGTYDLSIEKYKDCCSLISKKVNTSVKISEMNSLLSKVDINSLIKSIVDKVEFVKI